MALRNQSSWGARLTTALFAVGLSLIVGGGCSDSKQEKTRVAKLSEGCLINSDCTDPLVCAFKRCHDACENSRDCPEGQRCLASDRPFHVCQLPDETECTYHSDCPNPLVCGSDAECRDQCTSARDCLSGQVCTQGTCADDEELVDGKLPVVDPEIDGELGGQPCAYSSDCLQPLVCRAGLCRAECRTDRDCAGSATCHDGICQTAEQPPDAPQHCVSRETDGDETDVDCGGACFGCAPGASCDEDTDCSSVVCLDGLCQAPACSDDVRNGAENGTDCGGPSCDPCPPPPECEDRDDCDDDEVCKFGVCLISACGNGAKDGEETDIDCGGPDCPPCDHGARCALDGDCRSVSCATGSCAQPTCTDGVRNGNETDRDCGGPDCGLCANGVECGQDTDCASHVCGSGSCQAAACDDDVQNGLETDIDCGGVDCDPCGSGKQCRSDNDCQARQCLADTCRESFTLTVSTTGPGEGTVSSSDHRIQCGSDCEALFVEGTSVTLVASPAGDSTFAGFSGACAGTTCVVAMNADRQVTATFQTKAPATGWAVNLSPGVVGVHPGALAVDGAGRSVVVGAVTTPIDFGAGPIPVNGTDVYVAKYDTSGGFVWGRTFTAAQAQTADGVVTDDEGNVFVAGYTDGGNPTSYGGGNLVCNASALAIAKLSGGDGGHLNSTCLGANTFAQMSDYDGGSGSLALKSNGNLVFMTTFRESVAFGTIDIGTSAHNQWAVGELAAADLTVLNAVALGQGLGASYAEAIAAHPSDGSLAVVGECSWFDAIDAVPGERVPVANLDVCVAKLDAAFDLEWVRIFGSNGPDFGLAVDVADNGDVLVGGRFDGQLNYGGSGVETALSPDPNAFVVRLAAATGAPIWAQAYGGTGVDEITALAIDRAGNIGLVGTMSSGLDLGGGPLPHTGFVDLFFLLLDADGEYLDSAAGGTSAEDIYLEQASSVAANPTGGFLIHGRMSGTDGTAFGLVDTPLDHTFLLSLE